MANERTANDQRSDVKNPNNPAHQQDADNRANQRNPNHAPQGAGDRTARETPDTDR